MKSYERNLDFILSTMSLHIPCQNECLPDNISASFLVSNAENPLNALL